MRMRHSAVKPRFHSTRSALLVVYTTVTSCRPSTPVTHIVALTLLHLQHGRPLHILLSTPQSRFSETANPLEWFDPISHTQVRVRRTVALVVAGSTGVWRAQIQASALAQCSSSGTWNVLSTSSQCTVYNTTCLQMILRPSTTAQSPSCTYVHSIHSDPSICLPASALTLHCCPRSVCN